jgi:type II secretory pathway pseudopilin PulG
MAALLIGLSVMSVLMSAALPVWSQFAKREKEEELIWRGQQYARAVGLFQRKFANTYPPNLEILIEQRFLRKKYKDPITNEEFQLIPAVGALMPGGGPPAAAGGAAALPGGAARQPSTSSFGAQPPQTREPSSTPGGRVMVGGVGGSQPIGGIQGVVSKSKDSSIKIFNGRTKYNEWMFVYLAAAQRIGPGGQQTQQPGQQGPLGGPPAGSDRRPGVGRQGPGAQPPFGSGSTGQPTFGPAQPFGQPPPGGQPFGRPPVSQPGSRPPGR